MDAKKVFHKRMIYNLFDLLGDLGGLFEMTLMIFGFFLLPISEHSFIYHAARNLYSAKTKNNNLFQQDKNDSKLVPKNSEKMMKKIPD